MMRETYDVVVIGGGAAGLAGAVTLARSRRSVLVVDAGEPRNAPADGVHNYLTREGTPPLELQRLGREEVAMYGGEVVVGRVSAMTRRDGDDPSFTVTLDDRREVGARRVLVATGAVDILPEIPGVAERWGRDVLHCPYCHGWESRDRAIGVIGPHPMVMHAALLWRQISPDLVVFLNGSPALTTEQAAQCNALGVRVISEPIAGLVIEDDRLTGVRLVTGEIVPREIGVVGSRAEARADMLAPLGLQTTALEMGDVTVASRIEAGQAGATRIPGVYVAGNIADPMGQVIAAASEGSRAGAMINADLVFADAALAVALAAASGAVPAM
ncbi:MAG: NAD(P)/FAD-dependent oxidoreductase [Thermomicrobiales bacterium]